MEVFGESPGQKALNLFHSQFAPQIELATTQRRELMLALASRLCLEDTGQRPERVEDLIPHYLREPLVNASTGEPLVLKSHR